VRRTVAFTKAAATARPRSSAACLLEERRVDAVEFYREHAGVDFPPDTPPLPALVLRFTSAAQ